VSSIRVQSGRANDTTHPVSRQKNPAFAPSRRDIVPWQHGPRAETPGHRDRPSEYTPHVRLYAAHAYPRQNVATALQSAHSGRHAFSR